MSATNETTGAAYQGRNVLRLVMVEIEREYDGRRGWAGFKQWLDAGRVVRKGEHGTPCMTVVTVTDDKGTARKPRGFRVFHYDQTEPLPELSASEMIAEHTGVAR